MHTGVPTTEEIDALRGVGATTPTVIRATAHTARFPLFVGLVAFFALFAIGITVATFADDDAGWPSSTIAAVVSLWLVFAVVRPYQLGVVLDEGRIGVRHPLRPGTIWVDLDQVALAMPAIHIGFNLGGARRDGRKYHGPAGHYFSLHLWSREQGFRTCMPWLARRQMIPRQRRFVDAAQERFGRLRILKIDSKDYADRSLAAILIHLWSQLPREQAEQLSDIEEYVVLLRRWAEICYDVGGRHRKDWRRDPRTLVESDLDYGPGGAGWEPIGPLTS